MAENAIIKTDFKMGEPLGKPHNLAIFRKMDQCMASLDQSWPGDLDPQRRRNCSEQLIRQATIAIAGSPASDILQRCVALSTWDSLIACASMDLSLTKALGEAYLVPFKNVCTLMVGYRGFVKLLVNTGFVTHVESVLVYEGETFDFRRDERGPHWNHVPDIKLQGQNDKVVCCYAVGYTRGDAPIFEAMNAAELAKVKGASKAVQSGKKSPYDYWQTEMMRKAPIRRLQKYVPKVADNLGFELLAKAAEHDNTMYDLNGYAEAANAFQAEKKKEIGAEWDRRTSAEPIEQPEAPEPERTEDGHIIPPEVGQATTAPDPDRSE